MYFGRIRRYEINCRVCVFVDDGSRVRSVKLFTQKLGNERRQWTTSGNGVRANGSAETVVQTNFKQSVTERRRRFVLRCSREST